MITKKIYQYARIGAGLLHPDRIGTLSGKLKQKLLENVSVKEKQRNRAWLESEVEAWETFAFACDSQLLEESKMFGEETRERARMLSKAHDIGIQGAGHYELLYFLTRHLKPKTVVETGVSKGFSTRAVLKAMDVNGVGHLHSSDFPNLRQSEKTRATGIMVEEQLKGRWTLHVNGDRKNIPRILADVGEIDLLHYDSDKNRSGREFAMGLLDSRLGQRGVLVMDDIDDDLFFHDYVQQVSRPRRVMEVRGEHTGTKFIGVVGI